MFIQCAFCNRGKVGAGLPRVGCRVEALINLP